VINIVKNKNILFRRVFAVIIIVITLTAIIPSNSFSINENYNKPRCNCVVFRLDDVRDNEFRSGQIIPMQLFLLKNQTLSLALIMNQIGNDSKVINKVQEGVSKGLFELDIHGWNHADYRNLTQKEQRNLLELANERMKTLFGKKSENIANYSVEKI
jgi:Polysaccharide deacetylase